MRRLRKETIDSRWRQVQAFVNSTRMLSGLPPFAQKVAERFYDVESADIIYAIRNGDVALFVSLLLRLDQLHLAAVGAGRTIAEIAPIVRCKGTVDAYMAEAAERLRELGGRWPFSDEPEECPASPSRS